MPMSEEEKQHLEVLDEMLTAKLYPFYWVFGILVLIMMATTGYLYSKTDNNSSDIIKLNTNKMDEEKAYSYFLEKRMYHILQKDARKVDLEADKNLPMAPYLIDQLNLREADELDLVYKTRGSKSTK